MSTSQPAPSTLVDPIIEAYAQSIRPTVPFILIPTAFSAILVPLLILLLVLSTPRTRRAPIFILNVLAVFLGIIVGVLCVHLTITGILSPVSGINTTEGLAFSILYIWTPWLVEAVLLFRVVAIYGPSRSRQAMAAILAFPIAVKAARAGFYIQFLVNWHQRTIGGEAVNQSNITNELNPTSVKVSYILEVLDNAYISSLFLWRLAVDGHLFTDRKIGVLETSAGAAFASRLQSLFWIASTNFIFPLILGLCQIIILFTGKNILLATGIEVANIYLAIVSTALATIWSSTRSYKDAIGYGAPSTSRSGEPTQPIVFHTGTFHTSTLGSVDREVKGDDGIRNLND
ncbi:hypothetical protein GGX14DRAFT_521854 [Mycena pura]|uniref:Uncharacterized protein n=1 Tax=Mycena pura TaxID=153505 RepID=A0AAD6VBD0_9AGAR|nr:hypothetical protein GGX14DRAFT_521854 [Mycena pura]